MKVAIHQPNYLPYAGFFKKASMCDVFVFYDTAQFTRGNFINRNKIRTRLINGWMWLTLPVGKHDFGYKHIPICFVNIKKQEIIKKHAKTIEYLYSKTPFFDKELCNFISTKWSTWLHLQNYIIISYIFIGLEIYPKLWFSHMFPSSDIVHFSDKSKTDALIDIVKAVGGTEYISGDGARAYLEPEKFAEAGIKLSFVNYKPIVYPQIHAGFVKNMSIIDLVFNVGWKEARRLILSA